MVPLPALVLAAALANPPAAPVQPPAAVAAPATPATPAGVAHFNVNWDVRPGTPEQCARAAVYAMGVKEKFRRAAIGADGSVTGDAGGTAALVTPFPHPDGVVCLVVTVGRDNDESARLNLALRDHIKTEPDPAGAKSTYSDGTDLPYAAPHLSATGAVRPAGTILRFFVPAAGIALEKHGLGMGGVSNGLVGGNGPGRFAFLYCLPGSTAQTCQVGGIVASDDAEVAKRTAAALSASLGKILFE